MRIDSIKNKNHLSDVEIEYHRTKVIFLSKMVIKNPKNIFKQIELKRSLEQLDKLLIA